MNLGDPFPNFKAKTTHGDIDFYEFIGDQWAILFSHPADFTPVCTTELARAAQLVPEFHKRNVYVIQLLLNEFLKINSHFYFRKLIALSCDTVASHLDWVKDISAYGSLKGEFPYPIIDDASRELAVKFNMLDKDEIGSAGLPLTCRAVFIIDSSRRLRTSILYPASTGRNFDEILRVIDSLQLTDKNKVATPVDWKQNETVMVLPTVKNEDIPKLYPKGVEVVELPSGKQYLRKTPCPQ